MGRRSRSSSLSTIFSPLLLVVFVQLVCGQRAATQLHRDLLIDYDPMVRPAVNFTDTVNVSVRITLLNFEIDAQKNEIISSVWMGFDWTDERLKWNPDLYDGVDSIRLMPDQMWVPDIMPYTMLPRPTLDWLAPVPIVVANTGALTYVAPAAVHTSCRREYRWDDQFSCRIKLGSWTYDAAKLNLIKPSLDLSSLVVNPIWSLRGHSIKRNEIIYDCCPEVYVDITLKMDIGRKVSDQGRQKAAWPNLPVAVSVLLSLAGFLVPVTSPQKLTLPSLALVAAGTAAITEFGLDGDDEYRAYFLRVYHLYTYAALSCVLWAVLMLLLGRPRPLRLPACLRNCLGGWLPTVCCLTPPPQTEDKAVCSEWVTLSELLDRTVGMAYFILVLVGTMNN